MKKLLVTVLLLSCQPAVESDAHWEALKASVTDQTAYGRDRLLHYREWQSLPEDDGGLTIPAKLDRDALLALGREAFHHYPAQPPFTCASCHSFRGVDGLPNRELDVGAMLVASHPNAPPEAKEVALSWGPGRVDVSTTTGTEPARIPDLRPVRFLRYLQWSGAVKQNDVMSLAVRIETLIVTARDRAVRPPRAVSLALATYVWSLADGLSTTSPPAAFAKHCGGCHEGPGLSGGLVDPEEVGTDPKLAHSADRGTGFYRVPSLRGVGSRGALMHDGSVADVDALLRSSHVPDLDVDERATLAAFLRDL
ncbi:MAG: c-type cytochrome [Polyangiales bacterium]